MPSSLEECLREFEPDADALLKFWCQHIADDELAVIADADYGYIADEHLTALQAIRDTASIAQPFAWVPREVCELVRWSGPNTFTWSQAEFPSPEQLATHRLRGFASTVLVTAPTSKGCLCDSDNQSAAVLLASSIVLGEPHVHLARRLLAVAAIKAADNPPEQVIVAFGALLAAVAEPVRLPSVTLDRLARAIIKNVDQQHAAEPGPSNQWMLGLTFYNIRHDMWTSLAKHLLVEPRHPHPPEANESLRLIGGMVAG